MEAKLKKELENAVLELSQKEKELNAKILELAQANSAGVSEAVAKLETNQKEQMVCKHPELEVVINRS